MQRQKIARLIVALVVCQATATAMGTPAMAGNARRTVATPAAWASLAAADRPDYLPGPLNLRRTAERQAAASGLLSGRLHTENRAGSHVVRAADHRYVQVGSTAPTVDQVFTVLVDFGSRTIPAAGGSPGPLHNQIPRPDRTVDNTTLWQPDFSPEYYRNLLFGTGNDSVASYYHQLSHGKYTLAGDVSDWVTVPFNEARYGSLNVDFSEGTWNMAQDAMQAWYDAQVAARRTPAQIHAYLSRFDVQDPYDYDGDGNFNEPDGYLDNVKIIHAGPDKQTGGGAQGTDALSTHTAYAFVDHIGATGPDFDRLGGVPLGASGFWVNNYNLLAENSGPGQASHENGHLLGLPDLYDPFTAIGNSDGYWSLMARAPGLSRSQTELGSAPAEMGAWERLQLGWLNLTTVKPGTGTTRVSLSAAAENGALPQALAVPLPDQQVTTNYTTPFQGSFAWYSDDGDELDNTLTRDLDLTGATSATLTTKMHYDAEEEADFFFGKVSTDGGATWHQVGPVINGSSNGAWVDVSYDLSAYTGRHVLFRFQYHTDSLLHTGGVFLDLLTLVKNGVAAWTDDAETGDAAWVAHGFFRSTGTVTRNAPRYYLGEYRAYVGHDDVLQTGPYNVSIDSQPRLVEHFPYQDGLLLWYVNFAFADNFTSQHPGNGLVVPVDAHPAPLAFPDGTQPRNQLASFDATFGLQPTDPVTFHHNGQTLSVPAQPAVRVFDDSDPNRYWSDKDPTGSIKVAGSGTRIEVLTQPDAVDGPMVVSVTSPPA